MGGPGGLNSETDWFVRVHDRRDTGCGVVSNDLPQDGPDYWNSYKEDHLLAVRLGLNSVRIGVECSRVSPVSRERGGMEIERGFRALARIGATVIGERSRHRPWNLRGGGDGAPSE